jgi:hypothetical protein
MAKQNSQPVGAPGFPSLVGVTMAGSRIRRLLTLVPACVTALVMPACHAGKSGFQELKAHAPNVTLYGRVAGDLESGNTLIIQPADHSTDLVGRRGIRSDLARC